MTIPKKYQKLLDEFPFLTLVRYGNNEFVGIMQNIDNNFAHMYNYEAIKDNALKKSFLRLGEEWWLGTNRLMPINIIFNKDFKVFKSNLIMMSTKDKDFTVIYGPVISLSDINKKRIKRRNIKLIRKSD